MSEWKKLNVGLDLTLTTLIGQINTLSGNATSLLTAAETAINGASLLITSSIDPIEATIKAGVSQIQNTINDYFAAGGYLLVAHPYTAGLDPNFQNEAGGIFKSLSAPNAVKLAISKIQDENDARRPVFSGAGDAIALLVGSSNPDGFQTIIQSFNALLNLDELTALLDKINQIKRLEQNQFQRNTAPLMPLWQAIKINDIKPLDTLQDSLNEGLNTLKSFTVEPALTALKNAISKKKKQLETLKKNIETVKNALTGGISGTGAYQLKMTGNGTVGIANELKSATGLPGHELGYCAVCLFICKKNDMKILTKLFS